MDDKSVAIHAMSLRIDMDHIKQDLGTDTFRIFALEQVDIIMARIGYHEIFGAGV